MITRMIIVCVSYRPGKFKSKFLFFSIFYLLDSEFKK